MVLACNGSLPMNLAYARFMNTEPTHREPSLPPGVMKTGSGSQLQLILFLFRSALRSKEGTTRRLRGFPKLFPTPREDRFCRDTF